MGSFEVTHRRADEGAIIEVIQQGVKDPDAVRVELSKPADSIIRRIYSVPDGKVTHQFRFDQPIDLGQVKLWLTRAETFKQQVGDPARLRVPFSR
jgi:hypothetical protein